VLRKHRKALHSPSDIIAAVEYNQSVNAS
jgi:hypothetical protein